VNLIFFLLPGFGDLQSFVLFCWREAAFFGGPAFSTGVRDEKARFSEAVGSAAFFISSLIINLAVAVGGVKMLESLRIGFLPDLFG